MGRKGGGGNYLEGERTSEFNRPIRIARKKGEKGGDAVGHSQMVWSYAGGRGKIKIRGALDGASSPIFEIKREREGMEFGAERQLMKLRSVSPRKKREGKQEDRVPLVC